MGSMVSSAVKEFLVRENVNHQDKYVCNEATQARSGIL